MPCDPPQNPQPFELLKLPWEIRLNVYDVLLTHMVTTISNISMTTSPNFYINKANDRVEHRQGAMQVLRQLLPLCRQVRREVLENLDSYRTLLLYRGAHLASLPRLVDASRVETITLRMQFKETSGFSEVVTALRPLYMSGIHLDRLSSLHVKVEPLRIRVAQFKTPFLRTAILFALQEIQKTHKRLTVIRESDLTDNNVLSLMLTTPKRETCPGVSALPFLRMIRDSNLTKDAVVDWQVELPQISNFETMFQEFLGSGKAGLWTD